jgi:hypothetical protein
VCDGRGAGDKGQHFLWLYRGVHAPNLIHEPNTGKNFPWIGKQLIQKQKLFLRKHLRFTVFAHTHGGIIKRCFLNDYFVFIDDFCPAQKRPDAQEQFFLIYRLRHKVVRSGEKALLSIRRELLCGHHQYWQIALPPRSVFVNS